MMPIMLQRYKINLQQNKITYLIYLAQERHYLESEFLKIIYGVSPLNVTTYFNSNGPNDINNANIQLSIDLSSYATIATTYNQTEVDTLSANIPLSSYHTQTQLDTMFSTHYRKTDVDTLLSSKQDSLSNASGEAGVKSYPLLLNNTIKQLCFINPLDVSEELDNCIPNGSVT